jgi:hypothetical protein
MRYDVNTIYAGGGKTLEVARNIKLNVLEGHPVCVLVTNADHEVNIRTTLRSLGVNPNHHLINWVVS